MDWISIAYIAIIGIFVLIGLFRGGTREFWKLVFQAIAIALAFALCKSVGLMLKSTGVGGLFHDPIYDYFLSKVDYGGEEVSVTLLDEATRTDIYNALGLPAFIHSAFDKLVVLNIPETGTVVAAEPFVNGTISAICTGLGFLALYLLVALIGGIVQMFIAGYLKKNDNKPGFIGRLLGAVVGVIRAAGLLWVVSLVFRILFTFEIPMMDSIKTMIGWGDDSVFSFAKFFMNLPLGYEGILQFFVH
ncbi:MAG: hypothetical protein K6F32_00955 [Bacilli bacterium]|nr:hypothetical protein [Bacilli bacterium]